MKKDRAARAAWAAARPAAAAQGSRRRASESFSAELAAQLVAPNAGPAAGRRLSDPGERPGSDPGGARPVGTVKASACVDAVGELARARERRRATADAEKQARAADLAAVGGDAADLVRPPGRAVHGWHAHVWPWGNRLSGGVHGQVFHRCLARFNDNLARGKVEVPAFKVRRVFGCL